MSMSKVFSLLSEGKLLSRSFWMRPSSSPSPTGRRDHLSYLLPLGEELKMRARDWVSALSPFGRDGREAPVRAKEWVWERVRVRELCLRAIATLAVFFTVQ